MDGNYIINEDKEYIAGTYARFPVAFKEGKGCRLYDYDGKEYSLQPLPSLKATGKRA